MITFFCVVLINTFYHYHCVFFLHKERYIHKRFVCYFIFRSVVALAGDDFCVIGADTRLSTGFSIYTREQDKLFPLSNTTILGCSGCWCDTLTLTRLLSARMQVYQSIKTRNILH